MKTQINALEDQTAIYILNTIAASGMRSGGYETAITPELQQALKAGFGTNEPAETITEGDLAREALLVLSDVKEYKAPLSALVAGPRTERFIEPVSTIALVTAALFVLQTHVKIERDANGKITFLFEKKPTKDALLKPLVKKILGFLS